MAEPHPHSHPALSPLSSGESNLGRVDPRARVLAAVGLAVVVAAAQRPATLLAALAVAVLALAAARLLTLATLRRLLPLEIVLAMIALVLAGSGDSSPASPGAPAQGLGLAAVIALKANAIVVGLAALMGTMDATTFGHALAHLRVPQKLTQLLLLSIRYLDLFHREYLRLRAAMKVRSFRPRMTLHTYQSYGYLVGMLLVRSFDRSERVLAAMKCRGFRGRFPLLDHFAFSVRRDLPFCAAAAAVALVLVILEWA